MNTATDEHGTRHDIVKTWDGAHTVWHRTGCGLTLPRGELFEASYMDEYCERCVKYKGYRNKEYIILTEEQVDRVVNAPMVSLTFKEPAP